MSLKRTTTMVHRNVPTPKIDPYKNIVDRLKNEFKCAKRYKFVPVSNEENQKRKEEAKKLYNASQAAHQPWQNRHIQINQEYNAKIKDLEQYYKDTLREIIKNSTNPNRFQKRINLGRNYDKQRAERGNNRNIARITANRNYYLTHRDHEVIELWYNNRLYLLNQDILDRKEAEEINETDDWAQRECIREKYHEKRKELDDVKKIQEEAIRRKYAPRGGRRTMKRSKL